MKILRLLASLSLAALTVIPLAACGENNTSSEMESTVAVTETARDETTSAFSDTTVPDTEFDLKSLHAIHDNGNDFAGAWHITERDAGDTYSSFTYVFDGNTSSYLITGSMGYISKYEINPDIKQMASQMMFGINGKYTYAFSDDKNTVTLTDTGTKKNTTLEKYASFSCIPTPEADPEIDSELVGAWKNENGTYLYFDNRGIMYETIQGLSFTFYNYSAENGKVHLHYFNPDETTEEASYSTDGNTLTYNGSTYEHIDASELV